MPTLNITNYGTPLTQKWPTWVGTEVSKLFRNSLQDPSYKMVEGKW